MTRASMISGEVDKAEVCEKGVPVKVVAGLSSAHSFVPGVMPLSSIVTCLCLEASEAAALDMFLRCNMSATSPLADTSDDLSGLGAGVDEDWCELRLRLADILSDSIRSSVVRRSFSACSLCMATCWEVTEFALEWLLDVGADKEELLTGIMGGLSPDRFFS